MKSMMVQIQRSGKPHLSTTPQLSHTCFTSRRDADLQEVDLYHPERQSYSPETQLAHRQYSERGPGRKSENHPHLI
ncbi:uncharacterized protein [Syngnathus scovelli]|uniref:uncharacterized protein isoform X5 n=1 Tax=Syngnathus scovelli TaxID=161590 RepID=UPI002110084C|nr:uncharacterized protein LOC125982152 isoform X4 [Syngnathus scovelli]